MKIFDFLCAPKCNYTSDSDTKGFISQIDVLTQDTDLSAYDVFMLGVQEKEHANKIIASDSIRLQFLNFSETSKKNKILDLGNIIQGKTFQDTVWAIKSTISKLHAFSTPIIVLGATNDYFIPFTIKVLEEETYPVVTEINSKINYYSNVENTQNYLQVLLENVPELRIIHLAHQLFYTNKDAYEWFEQKYFPIYRLAEIRDLLQIEPLIRDSHLINFNLSSIRYSDNPGCDFALPSGLFSEQASQIAWYSGFSDKMKLFFLTGFSCKNDVRNVSAFLSAQLVWHVIDGISQRKHDIPIMENENFSVFYLKNNYLNHDMVFYQSKMSKAMWVEVPSSVEKKRIVPCSVADYESALKNEIPNDWLLEFNRIFNKII